MGEHITTHVGLDVHKAPTAIAVAERDRQARFIGTVGPELGELRRFAHPQELMSFLGLVPSERSTGDHRRLGAITRTGNGYARRMLVEAAWNYRFPARISRALQTRQEGQPKVVRDIAWQAQVRLCRRYRALKARQIAHNKICVAVARELSGFVWAIAQQVEPAVPSSGQYQAIPHGQRDARAR